ncbi:MAG: hypothetical protein L0J17_10445 [Brevibacterium sp.]|nr:hypothetical protein [Brevibacterium sp.]MDN6175798.1 hypothetical protein [Brevibacterium sp.]MDN6192360.1 hypothetical protein [Brevibacterium sp.]MDN6747833.1 hypothetical protein [Brevibacterium sp.]
MNEPKRTASHLVPGRAVPTRMALTGAIAGLALTLTGCGSGNKNVYQYVGEDIDGGWILIEDDSVTIVDPDSDGVQQAITDIEEKQVDSNSDAYDVENGALNEAKDLVMIEDGDSASIEFTDDMIRIDGNVVYIKYDSDLATKDRESISPTGG